MRVNAIEISNLIQKRINELDITNCITSYEGTIISVIDGIIEIYGLPNAMLGEMLVLQGKDVIVQYAIVLNLERDVVGAVVLGSCQKIVEGMIVKCTGKVFSVPVGRNLLGRVVNTLGEPIDGKGIIKNDSFSSIEVDAPSVIDRKSVNEPIQTGYKAIDSMIPIGKGQRELIIGDRQTGKTAIAIDTIINQKKSDVKCIYVAIGQKISTVVDIVQKLKEYDALNHTIILVASASESAALQYLAPYSGCCMGEYFRDRGEDALIIYDDLSKHAVAYRQISLLLKRPPGREAYPGDIFYLHSRLLERSAQISSSCVERITNGSIKNRTGSLTAIPIIETQAGDVSSFVPTNVISITDGQIFLETSLFNSGIRPAINPGISVSRIGSSAQREIIKVFSGKIRTALAQYRELSSFSQFSSDLDPSTRKQLIYGEKIIELLKQKQYSPISIAEQGILLFIYENGFLDSIEVKNIVLFEYFFLKFFNQNYSSLINSINLSGRYNKDTEIAFLSVINRFKKEEINGFFSNCT
ncbi:MAG: F0F1 ATP synthase subunit alpha [Buchnera aphidicola (Tetraneura sorini)]